MSVYVYLLLYHKAEIRTKKTKRKTSELFEEFWPASKTVRKLKQGNWYRSIQRLDFHQCFL